MLDMPKLFKSKAFYACQSPGFSYNFLLLNECFRKFAGVTRSLSLNKPNRMIKSSNSMDFYQSKFGFKTKERFHIESIQNLVKLNKSQIELPRSNSLQKNEQKEPELSPYKSNFSNNMFMKKQFDIMKNITVINVSHVAI